MNVVLFGGSFNPPHLGHVLVIEQAFELIPNLDELWLVPDYHHTFAKENDFVSPEHRLDMTQMLTNGKVRVETYNLDHQTSGDSIITVHALKQQYPQHQFSFLMGSDNLKTFTKWGSWQKLLEEIHFYIYPRAGFPMKPLYKNMTPLEHPLQIVTNISSTMARKRLQAGLNVENFIPSNILSYIQKHHLYAPLYP